MLALKKMSRELCHEYFMHFENDAAVFEDEKMCVQYHYSENNVERYFRSQQKKHRIVLMIMLNNKPIGEIKTKDVLRKNKRSIHVLEKNGFKFVKEDKRFCYYELRRVNV